MSNMNQPICEIRISIIVRRGVKLYHCCLRGVQTPNVTFEAKSRKLDEKCHLNVEC